MCTCNAKPPPARSSTSTASSKSFAVSPSMVTMGSPRKSRRCATSAASRWATARASASTFSGKTRGSWCLRIIISTSTPKSSGAPSTSITRPCAGLYGVGHAVISTSTIRPSRLSCSGLAAASSPNVRCDASASDSRTSSASRGIIIGCVIRSSKGMTTLYGYLPCRA